MTIRSKVFYGREEALSVADFRRVLVDSGLGATRPVDDEARLLAMLSGASLVVTACLDDTERTVVGVARCITDFSWSCYLSELAVSPSAKGLGVGRGLVEETRRLLGPAVSIVLASMPDAIGFYERIGMQRLPDCFWFRRRF